MHFQRCISHIRETFFYNQTRLNLDVTSSKVSDFSIGKYTFEVGGTVSEPYHASGYIISLFYLMSNEF